MNSKQLSHSIRKLSAQMIHKAKSSHIGGVYSSADIIAVLYSDILKKDQLTVFDAFILSKGHCCAGVYAALYYSNYLQLSDIDSFGADGSKLMAHISHYVPQVDFSTGSLGHGLPFGIGKARRFRDTKSPNHVYVLLSDGELDEGSNWEAFMFAGFHKMENLTAIIDYNKLQSLTSTDETLSLEPLQGKLSAFGWNAIQVNGHDHDALRRALSTKKGDMPTAIICDTVKGYPISFMMDKVKWHYAPPNTPELNQIIRELNTFYS
jgi:transketolase